MKRDGERPQEPELPTEKYVDLPADEDEKLPDLYEFWAGIFEDEWD